MNRSFIHFLGGMSSIFDIAPRCDFARFIPIESDVELLHDCFASAWSDLIGAIEGEHESNEQVDSQQQRSL
jgi:hypothetical protein